MTARLVVASFVFAAAAFGQLQIDTASPLTGGQVGVAYSQPLAASGGATPYSWSATGLPGGLGHRAVDGGHQRNSDRIRPFHRRGHGDGFDDA